MDTTSVMIIVLFGGIFILGFVLKVCLFSIYDKVRNGHVKRMNAQRPQEMSRLSDRHHTSNH